MMSNVCSASVVWIPNPHVVLSEPGSVRPRLEASNRHTFEPESPRGEVVDPPTQDALDRLWLSEITEPSRRLLHIRQHSPPSVVSGLGDTTCDGA